MTQPDPWDTEELDRISEECIADARRRSATLPAPTREQAERLIATHRLNRERVARLSLWARILVLLGLSATR